MAYVYDDAGERVIKTGPQGETAYVNQFYVVRNREVATKHVFAGGSRLVSQLAAQPDENGVITTPTAGNSGQAPWGWLNSNAGGNNAGGTPFENDQYFYHPDHLGSSSYVTDIDGEIFQHVEYFRFGETFFQESSNTQRTPYLFTGKELDEEVGLYYFGARYYDPRTSVWQNPDPILASYMQGKPNDGVFEPVNLNLFAYVQNNPIIATDPSGESCRRINSNGIYCTRTKAYILFNWLGRHSYDTNYFAGLAMTVQLYGSTDLAPFGLGDGMTSDVKGAMRQISTAIWEHNVGIVVQMHNGEFDETGRTLETNLLMQEQNVLQGELDAIRSQNPTLYNKIIVQMNKNLNSPNILARNMFGSDQVFLQIVDNVRTSLGRDVDFANIQDRLLIGQALVAYIDNGGSINDTTYTQNGSE